MDILYTFEWVYRQRVREREREVEWKRVEEAREKGRRESKRWVLLFALFLIIKNTTRLIHFKMTFTHDVS